MSPQPAIVFLNFDGVLNSQLYYKRRERKGVREIDEIDPVAIGFLNQICEDNDAEVVVTSTWRLGRTVKELHDMLVNRGFTGEVFDKTKDLSSHPGSLRGNEVLLWMKENELRIGDYGNYRRYICLDDDSDYLYWQRNNLLLVDGYVGLTPKHVFLAKRILSPDSPIFP